jgi:hypothetical protein
LLTGDDVRLEPERLDFSAHSLNIRLARLRFHHYQQSF